MNRNGRTLRKWTVDDLPLGRSGRWSIERYQVRLGEIIQLPEIIAGARPIEPGIYTRLVADEADVWMSDTPAEFDDHKAVLDATGRILIHGLGIGCLPNWLLQDPAVDHIDIIEIDEDIIGLVGGWLTRKWGDRRVSIHAGNAFSYRWPQGTKWDCIFSDIWVAIDVHNLPEMRQLRERYEGMASQHECWGETEILERFGR